MRPWSVYTIGQNSKNNKRNTPDVGSYHLYIYSLYQDTEGKTQNDNNHTRYSEVELDALCSVWESVWGTELYTPPS